MEFAAPVGWVTFMRLETYLSEKLGSKVDLVTPNSLKPAIRREVLEQVIYI